MQLRFAKYLIRESFWLYLFGVAAFCLLLTIDYLSVWARFFIEYQAPASSIGKLMFFQAPWFLHMSMPIAVVFAVLLATGRLAKDSELKAAYSLGIAPYKLYYPILAFGLVVSLLAIYNNGFLEPPGKLAYNKEVNAIRKVLPPIEQQRDVSYVVDGEGIYYAGRVSASEGNPNLANLRGILISKADGTRISAATGLWNSEKKLWTLEGAESINAQGKRDFAISLELPFDLKDNLDLADDSTLTLAQLGERVQSIRANGGDLKQALFAYHRQLADGFSALIFAILAGALGLTMRNRSISFAWTIILLVFFYFMWTLSSDLFEKDVLPPMLAAWFTSIVVGSLGVVIAWLKLR